MRPSPHTYPGTEEPQACPATGPASPLASGVLFSQPMDPACRASVVIPARNEEGFLRRALAALRIQVDGAGACLNPRHYEVLLLLNNCTDRSAAIATAFRGEHPALRLRIAERSYPEEQAHVGTARSTLMDEACRRFVLLRRPGGVICSTDADTEVAPDWLWTTLRAIAAGCDAVGGDICLRRSELAALTPGARACYLLDRRYQRLATRLAALLDPLDHDPWPRHHHHFGASLACTVAAYRRAGGMKAVANLEDVAFVEALEASGARLRHDPRVRVWTSARVRGRVRVGLSSQLREWDQHSRAPHLIDSALHLEATFRLRAQLRRRWRAYEAAFASASAPSRIHTVSPETDAVSFVSPETDTVSFHDFLADSLTSTGLSRCSAPERRQGEIRNEIRALILTLRRLERLHRAVPAHSADIDRCDGPSPRATPAA